MSGGDSDIKAPDGYTLGGLRRVRKDGTILFNRGWWKAPDEWIGEKVWVHEEWSRKNPHEKRPSVLVLAAAPPGLHLFEARGKRVATMCHRTERPDAVQGYRKPGHQKCSQIRGASRLG